MSVTSTNGGNDLRPRNSGKIHGAKFKNSWIARKNKLINDSTQTHMSNIHKRIPIVKKPSPMEPLVKKSPFVKEALRFAPLEKETADQYSICKLHILTPQGRA